MSQDKQLNVPMDPCLHCADLYQLCSVITNHDIFLLSDLHLWERLTHCVFQGQQRNYLRDNLKSVERKFPSSYFNSVYSCFRFLFPVLLSMLPALPFLLFLTIVPSSLHCGDNIQSVNSPKNFLAGVKHPQDSNGKKQILKGSDFPSKKDAEPDREGPFFLKYPVWCFIQGYQVTKVGLCS